MYSPYSSIIIKQKTYKVLVMPIKIEIKTQLHLNNAPNMYYIILLTCIIYYIPYTHVLILTSKFYF